MTRYIALLRGINVGGKNKIIMTELKSSFERRGFENVRTYINSGNVIFDGNLKEAEAKAVCETMIADDFGLDIPVCIISADDLMEALAHAPEWWDADLTSKHNALFVIPPMTTGAVLAQVGAVKPEYEKIGYYSKVIFWSAPIATFSRTRLTKIVQSKAAYNAITIRNANTTLKLTQLAAVEAALSAKEH